ncbi:hypothetical protein FB45DRAFT_395414 [Roridomyces roridus]|uniref:Uncharacterized protein n=1 Tax=Roridomyces roridus TaxID=1738132 RepID=A0AAD7FA33_9AGAR|nr:hypothetical protein FB45DRAFT_395414 [Roridomyces roridus]
MKHDDRYSPEIRTTPANLRSRESSLYLSIFGNTSTGVAPKEFVNIFFREERLPIEEGWKRSEILITPETMNDMEDFIVANSNWTQSQACEPLVIGPHSII